MQIFLQFLFLENSVVFCHNIMEDIFSDLIGNQERNRLMRLRKESDDIQEEEVLLIAKVSDALAHPARVNIFRYIMQANRAMVMVCNKDLVEHFDYAQATISQHIKKLAESGLIEVKKQDKFSYYYANLGMLTKYLNATKKFAVS